MKFYVSSLVLSIFLISCNEAVYFFSTDDGVEDQPVVFDQNSIDFERRNRRNRRTRRRSRREKSRFIYQQPPQEELITLDGKVEFIQLASADIQSVILPSKKGIDIPVADDIEKNKQPVQLAQGDSMSPLQVPETSLIPHEMVENIEQLDSQKENTGVVDLPTVTLDGELEYSAIPELQPGLEIDAPIKNFIPRPLDFVFVIDTSQSMYQHLIDFKRKFSFFLQYFSNLDWQIAVTNADHGETGFFLFNLGALSGEVMRLERDGVKLDLRYLHPDILDYNRIFLDSISKHKLGEYKKQGNDGWEDVKQCDLPPGCQSYQEQPLKSLKSALAKNPDFFKKEADLVAIVISNSKERANDLDGATQPEEVIEQFRRIHGKRKRFEVYGVIITEGDKDCLEENIIQQFLFPEGAFSEKIAALSEITGGEVFSICSPDYEPLAQSIFNSFVRGIK